MEETEVSKYENMKVFLQLCTGFRYTAQIIKVKNNSVEFYDKYSKLITVDCSAIISIVPVENG